MLKLLLEQRLAFGAVLPLSFYIELVVDVGIESLIRLSRYCFWCLEFGGDYGT
jgi:hypothetical protein